MLAFLWLVRSLATPAALASPLVRGLGTTVPSLALGLVAVSLRRMALYDQAFGLTMLRLWVVGAAVWMGSVFVMTAVRNAGVPGGRNWLVAGAGASAVALVLAADVGNPEAFVARHNLARADQGAELDVGYLVGLSTTRCRCSPTRWTGAAARSGARRQNGARPRSTWRWRGRTTSATSCAGPDLGARRHDASTQQPSTWSSTMPADCMRA